MPNGVLLALEATLAGCLATSSAASRSRGAAKISGRLALSAAARMSHHMGQEANPRNFLLSHAMGPNVAGVIGSAVVAGVFISLL